MAPSSQPFILSKTNVLGVVLLNPYFSSITNVSRHNAFFELTCPYTPGTDDKAPMFNLVLKGGLPKLGMALISEEGNVIFDAEIDLAMKPFKGMDSYTTFDEWYYWLEKNYLPGTKNK